MPWPREPRARGRLPLRLDAGAEALRRVRAEMRVPPDLHHGDRSDLHRQAHHGARAAEESRDRPRGEPRRGVRRLARRRADDAAARCVAATRSGGSKTSTPRDALRARARSAHTGFTPTPAPSVVKLGSRSATSSASRACWKRGVRHELHLRRRSAVRQHAPLLHENGFDLVVDENDYVNPVFHGSWGVADEDLFARADEEFSKPRTRPFFSLVFTTSNHSPYEYPTGVSSRTTRPRHGEQRGEVCGLLARRIFRPCPHETLLGRTVFLVVADHNSRVFGAESCRLSTFTFRRSSWAAA